MQVQLLHSSPAFTVYAIRLKAYLGYCHLKTVYLTISEMSLSPFRGLSITRSGDKVRVLKIPFHSQNKFRKEVKQSMARKPMVTRSLKSTVATIACYNTVTNEMVIKDIELARIYPNNDKLMKAAVPVLESANLKPVHVLKTKVIRTLYGMPEQSFIEHAEKLTDSEEVEPEE